MKNRRFVVSTMVVSIILLLPALAAAHTGLTGTCTNCHIMHASEDNSTSTPNGYLLRKISCVGCHAYTTNDSGTGRAATGIMAPQINDSATPIAGGYFSAAGDNLQHNVFDLLLPLDVVLSASGEIPGSGGTPYNAGSQVYCESCHDQTIGHNIADAPRAGTAVSSYRMLGVGGTYVQGTGDYNFEVAGGQNSYDSVNMNELCARCHGLFHSVNQGFGKDPTPNSWFRHPTDVSLFTETGLSFAGNKTVPMGNEGADADMVMCISCHRPHGSQYPNLLRFNYAVNVADDSTAVVGCESCHGSK